MKTSKTVNADVTPEPLVSSADPNPTRVERAEDYSEIYFNHAQCGFTAFDVFAYLSETAPDHNRKMLIRQKTRLSMSPLEALLLSKFLSRAVAGYETTYGKISIPEVVGVQLEGE